MRPKYDAVVIGSGFGGSINAFRLAQAGHSVLVLERGRRYRPGEFPRDARKVDEILWRPPRWRGLYDVRFLSGIATIAASGVGGGSLVYASIHYRPKAVVFEDPRWPNCFNLETLDPYYERVRDMMGIEPVPNDIEMPKRDVFVAAAGRMGREVFDTPQAVSWKKVAGAQDGHREPCRLVAECEFGCQYGSKNTLDFNYLARAGEAGAELAAEHQALHIAQHDDGYEVRYQDTRTGRLGAVVGRRVIVAAGTLGSVELLLRSRDLAGTLPGISHRLGMGYSGNGDFLGSIQNSSSDLRPWYGPDVTSVMWFFEQEPGFALAAPTFNERVMQVLASRGQRDAGGWARFASPLLWKLLPRLLPWVLASGVLARTGRRGRNGVPPESMTNLFAIGRDNAGGRMSLKRRRLDIEWDYSHENAELVRLQELGMRQLAQEYGGSYAPLPTWSIFKRIITVHNLGGCHLSDSPDRGVVSTSGEVHGYPGLYVSDGSVIPTSIGSHPVMTIAAISEWIAERVLAGFRV